MNQQLTMHRYSDAPESLIIDASYCWLLGESKELEVTCERGTSIRQDSIAYADLDKIHPKLLRAVKDLFEFNNQGNADVAQRVSATTAYLLGSYLDLRPLGFEDAQYPYLCSVKKVASCEFPGYFAVVGHTFCIHDIDDATAPLASVNAERLIHLPADVVDIIWPHASKQVVLMEELGYGTDDILSALHNGFNQVVNTTPIDDVRFD